MLENFQNTMGVIHSRCDIIEALWSRIHLLEISTFKKKSETVTNKQRSRDPNDTFTEFTILVDSFLVIIT